MELKIYKLGDLCTFINGRAYLQPELQNSGKYKIVRVGNLSGGNNSWYYSDMELEPTKYCAKGDLLYAWACNFGPYIWKGDKTIYHYHIWKVINSEQIDKMYLYYLLKFMTNSFMGCVHGSTMLHITKENMESMEVRIHASIEEQRRIATILNKLDCKIELNRQINDNLEAQLRLITSRYIFSCPNLEKKRIGEIATVKAGGDCPITFSKTRTQKCNIPIFSNGTEDRGLYGFTNKAKIEGHSITVAARGTIGYCERRLMPFVPIIRLLAITPKEDGAYIYLHQVIRGMKFKKNGSVQQQLTVPEISFIEIPYPHSSVLHEYNKVASPIVEMIERNISENEILTKQRDELLPLLMNGQATVNYHLSAY